MKFILRKYLLLILIIPVGFFKLTAIYSIYTPFSVVNYDYLEYHLSLLLLPFILIFLFKVKELIPLNKKNLLIFFLIICIILRNLYLIYFYGQYNLFSLDLCLSLIFGILIFHVFRYLYSLKNYEKFIDSIILFHFIGIVISIILSLNKIDFRFNAQNLDVGSTGMIFGFLFLLKSNYYKVDSYAILALIILIFSGSRFCLILTALLYIFSSLKNFKFGNIFISSTILLIIFFFSINTAERILSSFSEIQDFSINNESSLGGRLISIIVGFQVLIENFMNVSFSSVNLIFLMNKLGYPTFPHSYLLISLIYFPVVGLLILFDLLKKVFKNMNVNFFYALFIFIFYGGITYNFKIYALILILIHITVKLESERKNEIFDIK